MKLVLKVAFSMFKIYEKKKFDKMMQNCCSYHVMTSNKYQKLYKKKKIKYTLQLCCLPKMKQ